jgi:hypothetical protein
MALAIVAAAIDFRRSHRTVADALLRWMLFFSVGLGTIWGFIGHTFFCERVAQSIGWQTSPFQFEVAVANLAFGVLGVLAPWRSRGFQAAAVIGVSIFGLGAAYGHVHQMVVAHNFAPNNAGVILWADAMGPVVMLALLGIRARQDRKAAGAEAA